MNKYIQNHKIGIFVKFLIVQFLLLALTILFNKGEYKFDEKLMKNLYNCADFKNGNLKENIVKVMIICCVSWFLIGSLFVVYCVCKWVVKGLKKDDENEYGNYGGEWSARNELRFAKGLLDAGKKHYKKKVDEEKKAKRESKSHQKTILQLRKVLKKQKKELKKKSIDEKELAKVNVIKKTVFELEKIVKIYKFKNKELEDKVKIHESQIKKLEKKGFYNDYKKKLEKQVKIYEKDNKILKNDLLSKNIIIEELNKKNLILSRQLKDELNENNNLKSEKCIINEKNREMKLRIESIKDDVVLCQICLENEKEYSIECGHIFCIGCIKKMNSECPNCRKRFNTYKKVFVY